MSKKAVVLLSGGLDSATTAAIALKDGYDVMALSFNYGQRHNKELQASVKIAQALGIKEHYTIDVNLSGWGGSALTDSAIAIPEDGVKSDIIPITYVPGRNTVFIALALSLAEAKGCNAIFLGINAVDYSGYPDCRPDYLAAYQNLANLSSKVGVEGKAPQLIAPLIHDTKVDIVHRAIELGITITDTWSCYLGEDDPCGLCDSCRIRDKALIEAGYPEYATSVGKELYLTQNTSAKAIPTMSTLTSAKFPVLEDTRAGLPNICGFEAQISEIVKQGDPVFLHSTNLRLEDINAGFACALHMHQPTLPAGFEGALISNLQYMFEHPAQGDNHNAGVFAWCYGRMGDFIPDLINYGCNPRIMLDYSGNLLWGLRQMGRDDIINNLKRITCDPQYQPYVEWLGTMWSHAVIPSTPIPDIKLHIQAWQHYFASIFGYDALKRVKGFSPPEMHLPNHPDTLYEYIKALKECGYRWLMVQEHSIETLDGSGIPQDQKYIPNRLVAKNSHGETISITALIKTQGSDTKLVAQMQPYFEAKGRGKQTIGSKSIPSLVTQIADGENGGVMMNEFPRDFFRIYHEIRDQNGNHQGTVAVNGTEYLELIEAAGVNPEDYPTCQAVHQHKIWQRVNLDAVTPEAVENTIAELKSTDHSFNMDGASWTNDLSWVKGYENVLGPMNQFSALFHQKFDPMVAKDPTVTKHPDYHQALLHNLLLQTSCFRYWGQGIWTDYARRIYDRGAVLLR
ncbi:7-cyano-7-deazaguanine synthase QueC [Aphanothece hegewaldii CCALA 016]|uniref:7-cyano-7-deazaguanine synthase n=2 Tax=Aphanothece TaxID=1121 RepID=A0A2T1M2H6_9CHRO|nr:7-cyano-7-deazaguanine synthase QueC [Aphanothece hegewaldii CCALA 016]